MNEQKFTQKSLEALRDAQQVAIEHNNIIIALKMANIFLKNLIYTKLGIILQCELPLNLFL